MKRVIFGRALLFATLLLQFSYAVAAPYSYLDSGANWQGDCSSGRSQSPIDLQFSYSTRSSSSHSFKYLYKDVLGGTFQTAGNQIKMDFTRGLLRVITRNVSADGKPAEQDFSSLQFHFH